MTSQQPTAFSKPKKEFMTTAPRQKRNWRPWYMLPEMPICADCKVICIVKHTRTADDGKRIQHRYCPKCRKPYKTTYRPEAPSDQKAG